MMLREGEGCMSIEQDKIHMIIKEATTTTFSKYKEDIFSLLKLAYSASFDSSILTEAFLRDKLNMLEIYLREHKCTLLLAEHEGSVVGICHYFIKDDFEGKRGHINSIAIDSSFQGARFHIKLDSALYGGGFYER